MQKNHTCSISGFVISTPVRARYCGANIIDYSEMTRRIFVDITNRLDIYTLCPVEPSNTYV